MYRGRMPRKLAAVALLLVLGCGPSRTGPTAPSAPVATAPGDATAAPADGRLADRAVAIGEEIVRDGWSQHPEAVATLRPPGARYDRWHDGSPAGIALDRAREDAWREELRRMDPGQLAGRPDARIAHTLAWHDLENRVATRVCQSERWRVSHLGDGWVSILSVLGQAQPVGTPELRAQLLTRFRAVPTWVDGHVATVRLGLASGHLPPRTSVVRLLAQLDQLLKVPPTETPFYGPAKRDGDAAFAAELEHVVKHGILPTIEAYRAFVATEVQPKAREALGVAANPDGAGCYRAHVRRYTTLDIDPDGIARHGREQVAVLEAEMQRLVDASYGGGTVRAALERLRTDPARRYADREVMLAQASTTVDRARKALPRMVNKLPRSAFALEPIPAFQEASTPPHYLAAALDGSRPAAYRIRLYKPTDEPRAPGEAIAFHETLPGHHLQIAIANESTHLPMAARFSFQPAFGEGWGLYAERLADELGLYSAVDDRMGMLASAAWRATRLVVDTGLHAQGWDRQRAIDELLAHTTMSPAMAASEVDRYIAWPGQATAYTMGYLEIMRLRRRAEEVLGQRFDLRTFHDRLLEGGHQPLRLLVARIEAWLAEEAGSSGPITPRR